MNTDIGLFEKQKWRREEGSNRAFVNLRRSTPFMVGNKKILSRETQVLPG
jgi:hypothetical protein